MVTQPETAEDRRALRLRVRQIDLLYKNAPLAIVGGVMVVVVFGLLLYPESPRTHLYTWLGVTSLVYVARYVSFLFYKTAGARARVEGSWGPLFHVGTVAAAACWGWAGVLLVPHDAILSQSFLMMVLAGLSAASAASYASVRGAAALFIVPSMLPLVGLFFFLGDPSHLRMGMLGALFMGVILLLHERMHRATRDSIALGLENSELSKRTQAAHDRSVVLNDELTAALEEQKRTADSLRQSEARLKNAQRIAGFGHWERDLLNNTVNWSDQLCRIFGVTQDVLQPTMQGFLERVHPDDRERLQGAIQAAVEECAGYSLDYRILWHDGSVHVVHEEVEVTADGAGRAARLAGVIQDITRRSEIEARTRRSERELARILESMQDTYIRTAGNGCIVRVSPSAERLLGYTVGELIGLPIEKLYAHAVERRAFNLALEEKQTVWNFEVTLVRKDGVHVCSSMNAHLLFDKNGEVAGVEGMARDITEQKRNEEELHRSRERALVTLESIGDGVVTTDADGRINYLNKVAERLVETGSAEAEGMHYRDLFPLRDAITGEPLVDLVAACVAEGVGITQVEQGVLRRPDGGEATLNTTVAPMRDTVGRVTGAVLVLHDITALMGMAKQLSHQASHDLLTGLVNRYGLEAQLEKLLQKGGQHALFYLDLDQLKVVNDTCGHHGGDDLLKQLAGRFQEQLPGNALLARIGGDEFALLFEGCTEEQALRLAEGLRDVVREFRFSWHDKAFECSVSIGVMPFEAKPEARPAELMSATESICFLAKEGGRNRIEVHRPEDGTLRRHQDEMEWVHRITQALEDERFTLYLQPIVPLDDESALPHFEVLMRMLSLEGKVVPPGAYISAAERYHLMSTLDRWVVRTTLEKLKVLQGNAERAPVVVGVNLSGQSMADPEFHRFVLDLFEEIGVAYESVVFEVTETAAIGNLEQARNLIDQLRGKGCGFALDDFGAGLSSFAYLKNLPVDYLKIDGAFVRDMVNDRTDRAMVAAIHQVGAIMGIKTIAEYVDSRAAVEALREIGVDFAQGYWLGAPAPWQEALKRVGPTARARVREVASEAALAAAM